MLYPGVLWYCQQLPLTFYFPYIRRSDHQNFRFRSSYAGCIFLNAIFFFPVGPTNLVGWFGGEGDSSVLHRCKTESACSPRVLQTSGSSTGRWRGAAEQLWHSEISGFVEWVLTAVRSHCIVINRWQRGFRWTDLGKYRTVLIYVDFNAYLKLQPQSLRPSALGKSLRSAEAFTFLLFVHFLSVLSLLLIPLISLLVQCCCTRTLPKNVVGLPRWFRMLFKNLATSTALQSSIVLWLLNAGAFHLLLKGHKTNDSASQRTTWKGLLLLCQQLCFDFQLFHHPLKSLHSPDALTVQGHVWLLYQHHSILLIYSVSKQDCFGDHPCPVKYWFFFAVTGAVISLFQISLCRASLSCFLRSGWLACLVTQLRRMMWY